jgi:hypothetical protein
MRADFRAFFQDADRKLGIDLFEPDRRAERPAGPPPTITTS